MKPGAVSRTNTDSLFRVFACPQTNCNRVFNRQTDMQQHANLHAGDGHRLLQCPCGFGSTRLDDFELHLSHCPRAAGPCLLRISPLTPPFPPRPFVVSRPPPPRLPLSAITPRLPPSIIAPRLPPSVITPHLPPPITRLPPSVIACPLPRFAASPMSLRPRVSSSPPFVLRPSISAPERPPQKTPDALPETQSRVAGRKFPARCRICGKVVRRPVNFAIHMKTHNTDDRAFACTHPGCGRKFPSRANLRRHETTHSDRTNTASKRPLKCSHPGCDRMFEQILDLRQHERQHD